MTDKELKRLRRDELLEMLIEVSRRNEELEKELAQTKEALTKRDFILEQAGTMADAAIRINAVFIAADAAAKQYLENIRRMEEQTRRKCAELEETARKTLEEAVRAQEPPEGGEALPEQAEETGEIENGEKEAC